MTMTTEAAIERWDERYSVREYIWNAGPNQFVERYLADLKPATAVDLAAGEGRNAGERRHRRGVRPLRCHPARGGGPSPRPTNRGL